MLVYYMLAVEASENSLSSLNNFDSFYINVFFVFSPF